MWHPTVAIAIEVLSPGDETWDKLAFYAEHHVDELLVADPDKRTVRWLSLGADGTYGEVPGSRLIGLTAEELAARISWPAAGPSPDSPAPHGLGFGSERTEGADWRRSSARRWCSRDSGSSPAHHDFAGATSASPGCVRDSGRLTRVAEPARAQSPDACFEHPGLGRRET